MRLTALWIGLVGVLTASAGDLRAADATKPNVLILVADDLGYADLGFQGGKDIPTPNIDKLAKSGVSCSNGYVSGPYCSPTRAGLLTGRYQQRFGHEFNPSQPGAGLPVTETTIADRLKAAGYSTGLVGKWHLGNRPEQRPNRRGFDEFFGFLGGAHTYFAGKSGDIYRNNQTITEPDYFTDAIGREASAFVETHKAHPFFLEVTFNAVHTPMEADSPRLSKFAHIKDEKRRTYAAMLSAMDDAIGKILGTLDDAGLREKTMIVFISDNGGPTMLGTSVNAARNVPLRGSKRTTLEGGIRVPFVLSWKGVLPEGKVYDEPVIQLDILPTALAAAGKPVATDAKLDGVDLVPYLTGKAEGRPHEALFWRFGKQSAVRQGNWKLVRYDAALDQPGTRSAPGKVKVSPARLYDLSSDIGESKDLSADHPEKVKALQAAWDAWDRELVPPLWGPAARGE